MREVLGVTGGRYKKQFEIDRGSALTVSVRGAYKVMTTGIVQEEPRVIDGLALTQAFLKITGAEDRRKVIAVVLARASSPPLAPR
jgi:hypothetical protein